MSATLAISNKAKTLRGLTGAANRAVTRGQPAHAQTETMLTSLGRAIVPAQPKVGDGRNPNRGESKLLQDLKKSDQERYAILKPIEQRIRAGRLFAKLEDVRIAGQKLSKDFLPGKSRKTASNRLLAELAGRDISEIRTFADWAMQQEARPGQRDNAYLKLADHIIGSDTARDTD